MKEIWKNIKGYENTYQISNLGRVRSKDMMVKNKKTYYLKKGRILKPIVKAHGYLWVSLKGKLISVHRLVAENFIDNPYGYYEINHKDENKQNNYAKNLEWCTHKYNCEYSKNKKVNQYKKNGEFIKKYNSIKTAAEQTKTHYSHIVNCCKHKYGFKTANGFKWEYAE